MENKTLVAYFSASGVTAKAASSLAAAIGADLYEIKPAVPYTNKDLNWQDKRSRSSMEMNESSAPRIIQTFLESCDFAGKTIILFATSGGSGLGRTANDLASSCPGAVIRDGQIMRSSASAEELKRWAEQF